MTHQVLGCRCRIGAPPFVEKVEGVRNGGTPAKEET
jgi:hypothetical protein